MKQTVIIKSNKYGITLFLDKDIPFQELLKDIAERFKASEKFFAHAQMVLVFEGRELDSDEQNEVLRVIQENSSLKILCVVENDNIKEAYMHHLTEDKIQSVSNGRFYKGTLRAGQVLESLTSIIVLGDVNQGATLISNGNVVVLGSVKGTVRAGASGNSDAFVAALHMAPSQIRIGESIARCDNGNNFGGKGQYSGPMIAYTDDGSIYMEPITKEVLEDIRVF